MMGAPILLYSIDRSARKCGRESHCLYQSIYDFWVALTPETRLNSTK